MTHLKRFATLVTGILVTLFAAPAFAQIVEVTATNAAELGFQAQPLDKPLDVIKARAREIKENAGVKVQMELRPEAKMHLRATTSATAPKREEGFKALVKMHGGLIRERFTNALGHLDKFMARIDSRIEKMKAAGMDVAGVESLQVDAEASIDTAKTDIASVRTYIEGVADGSDRTTVKAGLEAEIKTAQESIREAHEAVRALVKGLVDLAKGSRLETSVDAEASVTN